MKRATGWSTRRPPLQRYQQLELRSGCGATGPLRACTPSAKCGMERATAEGVDLDSRRPLFPFGGTCGAILWRGLLRDGTLRRCSEMKKGDGGGLPSTKARFPLAYFRTWWAVGNAPDLYGLRR